MAGKNQPDRWEATLLAVAMAVAGGPFLVAELWSLGGTSFLSLPHSLHSAPVALVAVAAVLLLAEQRTITGKTVEQCQKKGNRHEL
jgi:hypothetical protein